MGMGTGKRRHSGFSERGIVGSGSTAPGPAAPVPFRRWVGPSRRPHAALHRFDNIATRNALAIRGQQVWAALADGSILAPTIERHPLDQAASAHGRLESWQTTGPLILVS